MRTLIIILCTLLCSLPVSAKSEKSQLSPQLAQIQALIRASGLEMQINQIPQALQQTAHAPNNPAGSFVKPLLQSLMQAFQPEPMLAILSQDLLQRLDVPTLLDAMAWYNSSNAKAIINAQKSISQPQTMEKVGAILLAQDANISPQRQKLLEKMADATQSNDIALNMMVNMQAAFMSGLSNMVAPEQAQSFDQLHATFTASKSMMRAQLSKQLLLQQAAVLESVPDQTIEAFLAFANTLSGKKLFNAINLSLDHTMRTVAQGIPEVMKQSQKPKTDMPRQH